MNTNVNIPSLINFPPEVTCEIFSYLDGKDLGVQRLVSKTTKDISDHIFKKQLISDQMETLIKPQAFILPQDACTKKEKAKTSICGFLVINNAGFLRLAPYRKEILIEQKFKKEPKKIEKNNANPNSDKTESTDSSEDKLSQVTEKVNAVLENQFNVTYSKPTLSMPINNPAGTVVGAIVQKPVIEVSKDWIVKMPENQADLAYPFHFIGINFNFIEANDKDVDDLTKTFNKIQNKWKLDLEKANAKKIKAEKKNNKSAESTSKNEKANAKKIKAEKKNNKLAKSILSTNEKVPLLEKTDKADINLTLEVSKKLAEGLQEKVVNEGNLNLTNVIEEMVAKDKQYETMGNRMESAGIEL